MAQLNSQDFTADSLLKTDFPLSMRGYKPEAVDKYLEDLSETLTDLGDGGTGDDSTQVAKLRDEVADLKAQLSEYSLDEDYSNGEISQERLTELLGQETAKIVSSANSAAAEILENAETEADNIIEAAVDEVSQKKADANNYYDLKKSEAEDLLAKAVSDSDQKLAEAKDRAKNEKSEAKEQSQEMLMQAKLTVDESLASSEKESKVILTEAKKFRHKIINDTIEKKNSLQKDLNEVVKIRSKLLSSVDNAHSSLSSLLSELQASDSSVNDLQLDELNADDIIIDLDEQLPEKIAQLAEQPSISDNTFVTRDKDTAEIAVTKIAAIDSTNDYDDNGELESDEQPPSPIEQNDFFSAVNDAPPTSGSAMFFDDEDDFDQEATLSEPESDEVENNIDPDSKQLYDIDADDTFDDDYIEGKSDTGSEQEEIFDFEEVAADSDLSSDGFLVSISARANGNEVDDSRGVLPGEEYVGRLPDVFMDRDLALSRSGPEFRRRIKRALNDDQNNIIELIGKNDGILDIADLPSAQDHCLYYFDPLRKNLESVMRAAARSVNSEVSDDLIDDVTNSLANFVVSSTHIPLAELATEANSDDYVDDTRSIFRKFRNSILPGLVDDVLHEAFAICVYEAIGETKAIEWVLDPRCEPDPHCEINSKSRDYIVGEEFPSGHLRPLSVTGCRCLVMAARVQSSD